MTAQIDLAALKTHGLEDVIGYVSDHGDGYGIFSVAPANMDGGPPRKWVPVQRSDPVEQASLMADAARYRWLVEQESGDVLYDLITGFYESKEKLDAAIDAAMAKGK